MRENARVSANAFEIPTIPISPLSLPPSPPSFSRPLPLYLHFSLGLYICVNLPLPISDSLSPFPPRFPCLCLPLSRSLPPARLSPSLPLFNQPQYHAPSWVLNHTSDFRKHPLAYPRTHQPARPPTHPPTNLFTTHPNTHLPNPTQRNRIQPIHPTTQPSLKNLINP